MKQRLAFPFLAALLCLPAHAQAPDGTDRFLLPAAAPLRDTGLAERPNVLLIMADDLNVALGSYLESTPAPHYAGVKTPNLDRLAAEGVRFRPRVRAEPALQPVADIDPQRTATGHHGRPRQRKGAP